MGESGVQGDVVVGAVSHQRHSEGIVCIDRLDDRGWGDGGRVPGSEHLSARDGDTCCGDDGLRLRLAGGERHDVGGVSHIGDSEQVEERPVGGHAGNAEHLGHHDVDIERHQSWDGVGQGHRRGRRDGVAAQIVRESPAAIWCHVGDEELVARWVGRRPEAITRVQT